MVMKVIVIRLASPLVPYYYAAWLAVIAQPLDRQVGWLDGRQHKYWRSTGHKLFNYALQEGGETPKPSRRGIPPQRVICLLNR